MRIFVWLISILRRLNGTTPENAPDRRFDAMGGKLTVIALQKAIERAKREAIR